MTTQAWRPDPDHPYSERMVGPSVWVGLRQDDVDTSANFDWQHLIRIFRHTILDEEDEPTDQNTGVCRGRFKLVLGDRYQVGRGHLS